MAVRGFEGLEHYGTVAQLLEAGWTEIDTFGALSTAHVRTGTYSYSNVSGSGFVRNYNDIDPAETVVGLAIAWYFASMPNPMGNWVLTQFRNTSGRAHISVAPNELGRLVVLLGGRDALSAPTTQIGVSSEFLSVGQFYHIETEFKLHATTGHVKIRVNGRVFYELLNVNTIGASSGPADIGAFAFGSFDGSDFHGFGITPFWDDCAWWDSEVDGHHDGSFIGQHGVYYLPPIADGTYEEFLLSAGIDSFALVDEIAPDDDATYVFSDAADQRVSLTCTAPLANVDDIECLQVIARAKKTASGDADLSVGVRTAGGTEDLVTSFALTTGYFTYGGLYPVNPQTAGQWSPAAMPQLYLKRSL